MATNRCIDSKVRGRALHNTKSCRVICKQTTCAVGTTQFGCGHCKVHGISSAAIIATRINRISNFWSYTITRCDTNTTGAGCIWVIGSKCIIRASDNTSSCRIIGIIVGIWRAVLHTLPCCVVCIESPVITILNTLVRSCVCIVISGAVFNTSFVDIFSICAIRAFCYTVPCCVVCIITIRTLILALFCNIVSILLARTVGNTS